MFSILVGLWILWFVVLSRKWHALLMIGLASLVAFVPLAPVLYKYATVHSHYGFVRDYWEIRDVQRRHRRPALRAAITHILGWLRVQVRTRG